ncbi:MAG: NAD(P)/FAD-dependent oxidoreductase, partial [Cyanobacteria bacterium J06638_22]
HEAVAIARYFRDLSRARDAFALHCFRKNASGMTQVMLRLAQLWKGFDLSLTTEAYLDRYFTDDKLKALLASQWLTYGVPPSQSPFALHATIASHYLDGAYYPIGGAETIAQSIIPIIEAQGGKVLVSREVTEILMEEGRAIGVRVRNFRTSRQTDAQDPSEAQETYFAPVIISNVGAANTYLKLLPSDVPIPFRESLKRYMEHHHPATTVCLYVGFSKDPRQLGFKGENHWIYEQFDHEAIAHHTDQLLQGQPQQIYLSFPSLKDPTAQKHTAELLSQVDYSAFAPWKDQPWLHRGTDYQALKARITEGLLATVDRHYPGFADLVDYAELSTPLTNEHFTAHPQGAIYGLPVSPERFLPENAAWMRAKTPIPGLYLTGVDLYVGGIVSAMFSGLMTVSQIPDGMALPAIFSQAVQQQMQAKQEKQQDGCNAPNVANSTV